MHTSEETRDIEKKLEKARIAAVKPNSFMGFDEAKENVVGLARNIRDASADGAHQAADYVADRVEALKDSSVDAMHSMERRIQLRPVQSVAIAFATGLLASFLLGRRSS